jgi:hypothetical protein
MGAINDILLRPFWFITLESLFEIVGLIITFLIAFYSYKVYKIAQDKKYLLFSASFLFMSVGFFLTLFSNFVFIYLDVLLPYIQMIPGLRFGHFYLGSLIISSFLMLSSYILLSAVVLNIRNKFSIALMLIIALLTSFIIIKTRNFNYFYFFSFVLLSASIVPAMYENYKKLKTTTSFLVYLGFTSLGIAHFFLLVALIYGAAWFYIIGQLLILFAYILLLINFVWCLKNG